MEMSLALAIDAMYVHKFLIKLLYTGYRPSTRCAAWDAYIVLYAMLLSCPLDILLMIMMGEG
jgi:hypothetical protein